MGRGRSDGEYRPSSSKRALGTAARDAISWVFGRREGARRFVRSGVCVHAEINGATLVPGASMPRAPHAIGWRAQEIILLSPIFGYRGSCLAADHPKRANATSNSIILNRYSGSIRRLRPACCHHIPHPTAPPHLPTPHVGAPHRAFRVESPIQAPGIINIADALTRAVPNEAGASLSALGPAA